MTRPKSSAIHARMHARLEQLKNRPYAVALLIGILAQLLFTWHLDRPAKILFDEIHYLPAAQALIDLIAPRNTEHPLVGKELLAAGLWLFGDNPFGWRLFATFAGTATVVSVFATLWLLYREMRVAVVGAVLVLLNQTLFVQARTAMLDVFLGAFLMGAIAAMTWAMRGTTRRQVIGRWTLGAVLIGLAVGSKWSAIPYVAMAGLAFLVIRARDAILAGKGAKVPLLPRILSGRDQPHWNGLDAVSAMAILGLVSIATYFLTFAPAFFYRHDPITWATLIEYQRAMYAAQTQVLPRHTYQSDWWSWPLMIRPIWYFYEWADGAQRGVLLIGNPVVMWGGLAAVVACYIAWFRAHAIRPLAMALLWTFSVVIYAIIPKSLGFYYYYHLSGIFLCLALAAAFHHYDSGRNRGVEEWFAALALLAFVYFYPILSGAPLADPDAYSRWMWFGSWR